MVRRILRRLRSSSTGEGPNPPTSAPKRPPVVRPRPPAPPAIPSPTEPRTLLLYRDDYCGYCRRVDRVIERLGLDVPQADTRNDQEAAQTHYQRTGRRTVPCLYIDDVPFFESADIIEWLEAYAVAVSDQ